MKIDLGLVVLCVLIALGLVGFAHCDTEEHASALYTESAFQNQENRQLEQDDPRPKAGSKNLPWGFDNEAYHPLIVSKEIHLEEWYIVKGMVGDEIRIFHSDNVTVEKFNVFVRQTRGGEDYDRCELIASCYFTKTYSGKCTERFVLKYRFPPDANIILIGVNNSQLEALEERYNTDEEKRLSSDPNITGKTQRRP